MSVSSAVAALEFLVDGGMAWVDLQAQGYLAHTKPPPPLGSP